MMNQQEAQTFKSVTSSNRLMALAVAIGIIAIGFSLWLVQDRYLAVSQQAQHASESVGRHDLRIERLEREHERMVAHVDRRLQNVETGVQEIRLWVAEQRGRDASK